MVLRIGYLQWHFRTHGSVQLPQPVLRDFRNIENRDALITYADRVRVTDDTGRPVTRWDGITTQTSPITGEPIPDESAQIEQYRYVEPAKAVWPRADYIVGNPPFIGAATMRRALGDGYVDAVRNTWPEVPESADFVMHWWHIAAEAVRAGSARRFGFITTNSIRQTFNRRVVQAQLDAKAPLTLAFAIADHPWVDAADGAAVRIAMTVGTADDADGTLQRVTRERETGEDEVEVALDERRGKLFADLKVGPDIVSANALASNGNISSRGMQLIGSGFIVTPDEAARLGLGTTAGLEQHIRAYRNGRDLADRPRGVMLIDLFGLNANAVRERFPAVYQWVLERVKPEREAKAHTKDGAGYAKFWWLFGKPRQELRKMLSGLPRFIATIETTKHRSFQFLESAVLPDNMLVCTALDDGFTLGILSSRIHVAWALAAGGTLENRPRYNKSVCFETFPFPDATPTQQERIRDLAEQLDAHRKHQQAAHDDLTLTGMYNVLETLRRGEPLTAKDKTIHEQGLVSVLRELHDALDAAVFDAYGWGDLAPALVGRPGATTPLPDKPAAQAAAEEALLSRLVALNAARAAEEARGVVRWLRPDYQNPQAGAAAVEQQTDLDIAQRDGGLKPARQGKAAWPQAMHAQVAAVRAALGREAQSVETIAAGFKRKPVAAVRAVLLSLEALGLATRDGEGFQR